MEWADYIADDLVCSILGVLQHSPRYPGGSIISPVENLGPYLDRVIVGIKKEIRYSAVFFNLKRIISQKKTDCKGSKYLTSVWISLGKKYDLKGISVIAAKVLYASKSAKLIKHYSKEIHLYLGKNPAEANNTR